MRHNRGKLIARESMVAMEYVILLAIILAMFFPWIRKSMLQRSGIAMEGATSTEKLARTRVRQVKYFYIHLGFYLMTAIAVILLSLVVGNENVAYVAAVVWGLAVLLHGFVVFVVNGEFMRRWEDRRVDDLVHQHDSVHKDQ
jgi:hypothetical protein